MPCRQDGAARQQREAVDRRAAASERRSTGASPQLAVALALEQILLHVLEAGEHVALDRQRRPARVEALQRLPDLDPVDGPYVVEVHLDHADEPRGVLPDQPLVMLDR
jgi:hypothetical protein